MSCVNGGTSSTNLGQICNSTDMVKSLVVHILWDARCLSTQFLGLASLAGMYAYATVYCQCFEDVKTWLSKSQTGSCLRGKNQELQSQSSRISQKL